MKKIICYLASIAIVVGMTACRNSDSSSADTSSDNTEITASSTNTTTTTTTTITTTITTTSKPEPITKSEPDDMELVYEKVLFDNSVIKAYLYDDDCILSQVYFSNDDPKTNIVNFSITASSVESEFANSDFKPSSISWWAFYGEDIVFAIKSDKQSDGTYSSPLGIVWYDNDYKNAYENVINNDDTVDETTTSKSTTTTEETTTQKTTTTTTKAESVSMGEKNALASAKSYLEFSEFSYQGLIEQLKFEGYTENECIYAVDNCGADWNKQALSCAKSYLDFMAFSYDGLIEQLEYELFTHEQAVYGADNCNADWNEQAAECAQSYLESSSFSRQELIDQLVYEGFTYDQAEYGVTAVGY